MNMHEATAWGGRGVFRGHRGGEGAPPAPPEPASSLFGFVPKLQGLGAGSSASWGFYLFWFFFGFLVFLVFFGMSPYVPTVTRLRLWCPVAKRGTCATETGRGAQRDAAWPRAAAL